MHRIRPRLPVFLRHRQRFRRLPKRLLLLGRRRSDPGVLSLHSGILHIYHLQRVVQRGLHPVPGRKPMPDDQLAHRVRLHVLLRRGLHLPDAVRGRFLLSQRNGPAQLHHRWVLLQCRFGYPATLRSWLFLSKRQRADPVLDANYYAAGSTAQMPCLQGYFCSVPSAETLCVSDSFCPAQRLVPCPLPPAPLALIAPIPTRKRPAASPTTVVLDPQRRPRARSPPLGSYCATPSLQTACPATSFCPARSSTPQPLPAGSCCSTPSVQTPCTSNNFCLVNAPSPCTVCTAGNYTSTMQWPEVDQVSDFVALVCTRFSHGRRFFDSRKLRRNVQKCVTQIIYLGPLPNEHARHGLRKRGVQCARDAWLEPTTHPPPTPLRAPAAAAVPLACTSLPPAIPPPTLPAPSALLAASALPRPAPSSLRAFLASFALPDPPPRLPFLPKRLLQNRMPVQP